MESIIIFIAHFNIGILQNFKIINQASSLSTKSQNSEMKSFQFSVIKFIISFASFLHYSSANAIFCDPSGICIPCFYRCRTCSGPNQWQCTQCIPEYVLTLDGYCVPCTTNCKSCAVGTVNVTLIQVTQLRCQTCINGYYLSQARGTCLKCPTGASQCTLSSIQACKQEYFLSNGICLSCPQNCQTCSSSSACLQCDSGYYLSTLDDQTCLNCTILNCKSCDSQWNCIECQTGFSGSQCLDVNYCGYKCAICYLSACFACQINYFLDSDLGACLPLEILCSAISYDISVCGECMSDIAYMSQQTMSCVPFYSISDSYTQGYITAINNQRYFTLSSSAGPQIKWCKFKQKNITYIYSANEPSIQIGLSIEKPIYGFSIIMQVAVPLKNYSNISIWVQSLLYINGTELKIEESAMPCLSSDGEQLMVTSIEYQISLNNFNLSNSRIKYDENETSGLYLHISSKFINSTNILQFCSFGISELLVQFKHCTIQNCQICTSSFTCSSCSFPYLLEDNNCILQCASGYYVTESVQSCTLNCLSGYYPIFQNYSCMSCQYPCTECETSGNQKCLKCQIGWFLQNDTICVKQCSQAFYAVVLSNEGICDYCLYPCKACIGHNWNCTSCLIGYFVLQQNYCTSICKNNTYLIRLNNEEVCTPCKSPCQLCLQQTKCLSCMNFAYYYELNYSCLQQCPNRTVGISIMVNEIENKKCFPCSYPCQYCFVDPLYCTSCQSGFLFNFSCVQQCPIGYYANLQINQCSLCVFPCFQCISQLICFKCLNITQVSLYEGICINKCPQTTYLSKLENMCIKCMPPCATCIDQMMCISCTSSMLILWEGKCLLNCPLSTFLSQVNGTNVCSNCSSGCIKCLSEDQCLKCNNISYRSNLNDNMSQCVNYCPKSYYAHQYLRQCLQCSSPCLTCLNVLQCLTCEEGYLFLNQQNKCFVQCPSGWVEDFNTSLCIQCDSSCLKCENNALNCTQCNNGYYLQPQYSLDEQKTCFIDCPSTYYAEQYLKMCLPCEIPCQTCDSRSTCLSCISSVPFLYLMQCVSECPFNTFEIVAQLRCQLCSFSCLQCSMTKDNCTKCDGQMHFMELMINNNTSGFCLSDCPQGYYRSEENVCYKCEPPCQNCEGSPNTCSSCINLFFYYAANCIQFCPQGYFPYLNDSTCYPCSQECSKCEGTSNNCTDCFLTYAFLLSNDTFGECVINCPPGYYGDSITRLCKSCYPTCIQCLSEGLCTKCSDGLLLFKDSCLTYCPEQFYPSNGTCLPCQSPCLKCLNMTECVSCVLPYYFVNSLLADIYLVNSCQTDCPPRTYAFSLGIDMRECLICSDKCLECYDYSACKNCKPNSTRPFLQQNDCLAECSPGFYYSTDELMCVPCSDKCISCSSILSCTQCLNSYLYKGKCIGFCPGGFYGDSSGLCLKCISPCQNCYDNSNCITCSPGYFLYQTFCLEHCPKNMWSYPHDRTCRNTCDLPYFDTTNKLCLQKCPAYYKQTGDCVEQCNGLGTLQIINSSLGCESCHDSCPSVPYMRLKFINKGYSHSLALIFSQNVELRSHLRQDQLTYVITEHKLLGEQTNQKASGSQLQPSKRRLLQTDSINLYPQDILVMTSSLIMLQLEQISINQASGMIQMQINNQLLFTYNGYPLQNKMAVDEVSSTFVSTVSYSWVKYIGWMISFTFWALLLVNVWFDNCKVMFLMVEILQSVHMMGYLDVWFHPIIQQLMQGLAFSAFYINTGQIQSSSKIWQCTIKKILYLDYCSYTPYILSVCAFLILFILMVAGGKLTLSYFNPNRHKLCWNHINDVYWIFSFTLFFIAFDHQKIVFATIATFFIVITLLIWYQSIKNIFTVTYAESTFFWALKKGKSLNPISNSNYPMAMCRRLILTVFISVKPGQSILVLSLTSLSTTLLAVNGIWNQPFKVHQRILPTIECLFAAFLFVLQIIVINVKSLNNIAWSALSWIAFILIITAILLCFGVVIEETIKIIKNNLQKYKKYKFGDKKSPHPKTDNSSDKESMKKSSTQQVSDYKKEQKQQKQKSSLKEAICTNQIIINQKNKKFQQEDAKQSPDQTEVEKQSSEKDSKKESDDKQSHYDENSLGDGWSSSMSLRPKIGAAKYLIKINKKNGEGGEREKDYKRQ